MEIPDSFNSCVVLYSVDVPFIWYHLYHLSVIHQLMSTLCFFALINHAVEKAMAPHSSTLAWKLPWTEELGGLQLLRVGHDWTTSLSLFTFMHWRRKWQPTPVFLPGEFHGQGSLVGYSPWGLKKSHTTEQFHFHFHRPRDYHTMWSKSHRDKYHMISLICGI